MAESKAIAGVIAGLIAVKNKGIETEIKQYSARVTALEETVKAAKEIVKGGTLERLETHISNVTNKVYGLENVLIVLMSTSSRRVRNILDACAGIIKEIKAAEDRGEAEALADEAATLETRALDIALRAVVLMPDVSNRVRAVYSRLMSLTGTLERLQTHRRQVLALIETTTAVAELKELKIKIRALQSQRIEPDASDTEDVLKVLAPWMDLDSEVIIRDDLMSWTSAPITLSINRERIPVGHTNPGVLPLAFGRFNVKVTRTFSGGSFQATVRMTPIKGAIGLQTQRTGYYHPHVNSQGSPCLGQAMMPVHEAAKNLDLEALVRNIHSHLSTYNQDNPYISLDNLFPDVFRANNVVLTSTTATAATRTRSTLLSHLGCRSYAIKTGDDRVDLLPLDPEIAETTDMLLSWASKIQEAAI